VAIKLEDIIKFAKCINGVEIEVEHKEILVERVICY